MLIPYFVLGAWIEPFIVYGIAGLIFVTLICSLQATFVWAGRTWSYRETFTRVSLRALKKVLFTRRYGEAVAFFVVLGTALNGIKYVIGMILYLGIIIIIIIYFYFAMVFMSEAGRAYGDVVGYEPVEEPKAEQAQAGVSDGASASTD